MATSSNPAQPTPGFVEYLRTLLMEPGTCRHRDKLLDHDRVEKRKLLSTKPPASESFGIPKRLCLFSEKTSATHELLSDIYYIDTKNLCKECYDKAFKDGFNVWSTTYFDEYDKLHDHDHHNDPSHHTRRVRYPQMREAFSDKKHWVPNQSGEILWPRLPGATIAHECWRWLVWMHAPFYIDQLCIDPPYRVYENSQKRNDENSRIAMSNKAAYDGARYGIIGTPLGGAGLYSTMEQQVLGEKKCVIIPRSFDDPQALQELGWGYIVHGDSHWIPHLNFEPVGGKAIQKTGLYKNTEIAQYQGAEKDTKDRYPVPSQTDIDKENRTTLHSTKAYKERLKRDAEKDRDKKDREATLRIIGDMQRLASTPFGRQANDQDQEYRNICADINKRSSRAKDIAFYSVLDPKPLRPNNSDGLPVRVGHYCHRNRHYDGSELVEFMDDRDDAYIRGAKWASEENPFDPQWSDLKKRVERIDQNPREWWLGPRNAEMLAQEQAYRDSRGDSQNDPYGRNVDNDQYGNNGRNDQYLDSGRTNQRDNNAGYHQGSNTRQDLAFRGPPQQDYNAQGYNQQDYYADTARRDPNSSIFGGGLK